MRKVKIDPGELEWMEQSFEHRLQVALYVAYIEARCGGKRGTSDEHKFELNADENLMMLRKDILDKTYEPSRSTAHIVHNPVIREIFAASFRDRVVHHLVFDLVYEWWDRHFINDSYSCRVGKGTLYGIRRLDHHIRSVSGNYARKAYVLQMDIKGYFMSLSRKELYRRAMWGLDKQFKGQKDTPEYEMLKSLWYKIIFDNPVNGAKKVGDLRGWSELPASKSLFNQPAGIGIVIGNLTSQLLSNIYLDQLDRFITERLGYKHYGRYVDDFYIVVTEEKLSQLKRDIGAIREYLKGLKLSLHPHKIRLQESSKGVEFLGAVVYHDYIVAGKRLKKNVIVACEEVIAGRRGVETVASYLGHLKYMDSAKLTTLAFERVGWEYRI